MGRGLIAHSDVLTICHREKVSILEAQTRRHEGTTQLGMIEHTVRLGPVRTVIAHKERRGRAETHALVMLLRRGGGHISCAPALRHIIGLSGRQPLCLVLPAR